MLAFHVYSLLMGALPNFPKHNHTWWGILYHGWLVLGGFRWLRLMCVCVCVRVCVPWSLVFSHGFCSPSFKAVQFPSKKLIQGIQHAAIFQFSWKFALQLSMVTLVSKSYSHLFGEKASHFRIHQWIIQMGSNLPPISMFRCLGGQEFRQIIATSHDLGPQKVAKEAKSPCFREI